jgi:2',3'-cyclic-nucleotide 2'-phosphodiesterase
MKIFICGDVVGKCGRKSLIDHLPKVQERLDPDFIIVNGENAAHGFGITRKIADSFFDLGVDVITTGNHVWDQREILDWIDAEKRVLRPVNFPEGTPGRGHGVFEARGGQQVLVVHPMGRLFMEPIDNPFTMTEELLRNRKMGRGIGGSLDAVVVDFHAEATSEKVAMGQFLDGTASLVVGTHTHVPTADTHILPGGTAFQCDLGMCGDYDSVIGMNKQVAIDRFIQKTPAGRLNPAEGEATMCGVFAELDARTGLAKRVAPVRLGGRLPDSWPAEV